MAGSIRKQGLPHQKCNQSLQSFGRHNCGMRGLGPGRSAACIRGTSRGAKRRSAHLLGEERKPEFQATGHGLAGTIAAATTAPEVYRLSRCAIALSARHEKEDGAERRKLIHVRDEREKARLRQGKKGCRWKVRGKEMTREKRRIRTAIAVAALQKPGGRGGRLRYRVLGKQSSDAERGRPAEKGARCES